MLVPLILAGCGDAQPVEQKTNGYIIAANGDPDNFTWSGFPRHRYAACGRYIQLKKPFEVVPGGWGVDPLAVPLSYLDNSQTHEQAPEGVDESKRLSFSFPALYRAEGMWEWQARSEGQRFVKPLTSAAGILKTREARERLGIGGETSFQGMVRNRPVAMLCSAINLPNPSCDIEVKLGISDQRFAARFPPRAVNKLERIVAIGESLFGDIAKGCGRNSPDRTSEIKIYPTHLEAERSLSARPR